MKMKVTTQTMLMNGTEAITTDILDYDFNDHGNQPNKFRDINCVTYDTFNKLIEEHPNCKNPLEELFKYLIKYNGIVFDEFVFKPIKIEEFDFIADTVSAKMITDSLILDCIVRTENDSDWDICITETEIHDRDDNSKQEFTIRTNINNQYGKVDNSILEVSNCIYDARDILLVECNTNFEDGTSVGICTTMVNKIDDSSYEYVSDRVYGTSFKSSNPGFKILVSRIYKYYEEYNSWKLVSQRETYQYDFEDASIDYDDDVCFAESIYEYINE